MADAELAGPILPRTAPPRCFRTPAPSRSSPRCAPSS